MGSSTFTATHALSAQALSHFLVPLPQDIIAATASAPTKNFVNFIKLKNYINKIYFPLKILAKVQNDIVNSKKNGWFISLYASLPLYLTQKGGATPPFLF
jgi:hypothetical protein